MSRTITQPSARPPESLATDREFCVAALPAVSRTFALSIEALPEALREAVRAAYLLCRVVDTVEDDARIVPSARTALFDAFDELLAEDGPDPREFEILCRSAALGAGSPDGDLCRGAGSLVRVFRALPETERAIIRSSVLEMSAGMRETCARADAAGGVLRLRDMEDLERYCYFVAGTVGRLLTDLFERAVPGLGEGAREGLRARAVSFGVGLQLVNILKDAARDFERGACFLPERVAEAHGLSLARLLDPESRPAGLAVVRAVCDRTRAHLARAREYVSFWPVDPEGLGPGVAVRLFCAVPLALALATLSEVEEGSRTLRRGEAPKVPRELVARLLAEARVAAASEPEMAGLFDRWRAARAGRASGSPS